MDSGERVAPTSIRKEFAAPHVVRNTSKRAAEAALNRESSIKSRNL